jgi:hypothetical protein
LHIEWREGSFIDGLVVVGSDVLGYRGRALDLLAGVGGGVGKVLGGVEGPIAERNAVGDALGGIGKLCIDKWNFQGLLGQFPSLLGSVLDLGLLC